MIVHKPQKAKEAKSPRGDPSIPCFSLMLALTQHNAIGHKADKMAHPDSSPEANTALYT
jgi:hypothetical protein